MNKMKQILYRVILLVFAVVPVSASAALVDPKKKGFEVGDINATDAGLTNATVFELIANVMDWLLGLIGVLGVLAFVISGVMYLTSAGDMEQVEKAKSVMLYAIIGLVVAFVGLIVVNAISGLTGAGGTTCIGSLCFGSIY